MRRRHAPSTPASGTSDAVVPQPVVQWELRESAESTNGRRAQKRDCTGQDGSDSEAANSGRILAVQRQATNGTGDIETTRVDAGVSVKPIHRGDRVVKQASSEKGLRTNYTELDVGDSVVPVQGEY
ncbi:hypothetical protein BaRGS_00007814 [Batillaria attramentaria]|uniref:Hypervirulence associated protein TUDOR domain-containing protein n=1 Tax=Batillaria attramentaria TaxID=370345 RepID=A0ABD0LPI5_9CAEN